MWVEENVKVAQVVSGMRFCRIKPLYDKKNSESIFGWVPLEAAEGDITVVVHGLDVPMVLRDGGIYAFYGPSFLSGHMFGEALRLGINPKDIVAA
jgi:hypothetical protein